ncbi:MAG: dTDP-4-dehydrorhamnose 3,5-epimerase family protein [Ignavibacteriales bacterium]|nr:dTDP-4-dehydrorhamnose 3,5-epimerase family protein [Ignavibacteriales bacterium]
MRFKTGPIDGVVLKELKVHTDRRGWLSELFRSDNVKPEFFPVMGYVSATRPGVARGPHEHRMQADFFCFVGPSMFRVVCWDSRKNSPTCGNKIVTEGGEDRPISLLVPPGVVHAYTNIGSTEGWVMNFPNALYGGKGRAEEVDEIRHEDDPETVFRMDDLS